MSRHTFHQISPHVHWLSPDGATDRPVLGAIAGERATLLIDAGASPDHARILLRETAQRRLPDPAYLALTHWHWDHIFGTAVFPLPTFASTATRQSVIAYGRLDWRDEALDRRVETGEEIAFCRDMIKLELPDRSGLVIRPPDIAFTDRVEVDLGNLTVHIVHVGGDHAVDSSVIYAPQDKIVFLGDCLYVDIYAPEARYTTARLFPLLDCLLGFDADYYLAGHHTDLITRAELEAEADLLRGIGQIVTRHGRSPQAIHAEVQTLVGGPLTEDHQEFIDAFLAGLPA